MPRESTWDTLRRVHSSNSTEEKIIVPKISFYRLTTPCALEKQIFEVRTSHQN